MDLADYNLWNTIVDDVASIIVDSIKCDQGDKRCRVDRTRLENYSRCSSQIPTESIIEGFSLFAVEVPYSRSNQCLSGRGYQIGHIFMMDK